MILRFIHINQNSRLYHRANINMPIRCAVIISHVSVYILLACTLLDALLLRGDSNSLFEHTLDG